MSRHTNRGRWRGLGVGAGGGAFLLNKEALTFKGSEAKQTSTVHAIDK